MQACLSPLDGEVLGSAYQNLLFFIKEKLPSGNWHLSTAQSVNRWEEGPVNVAVNSTLWAAW